MTIDGSTSGDTVSVRFYEEADLRLDEFGQMQPTKFEELTFSLMEATALTLNESQRGKATAYGLRHAFCTRAS